MNSCLASDLQKYNKKNLPCRSNLLMMILLRRKLSVLLFLLFLSVTSGAQFWKEDSWIGRCNQQLVDVIMEDLFTPPVASRVQVYPNIAAYEVLCFKYKEMHTMAGQLNGLTRMWPPADKIDISLAAMIAFNTVARKLVYSEYLIDSFQKKEIDNWMRLNKNDQAVLNSSMNYGRTSGDHIILWMKKDNYDHTRTLMRYVVVDSASAWQPTSPEYGNAIEPNWPLIRSFLFDSSSRIHVRPPTPFSEDKNSNFYKGAMEVYLSAKKKDTVQHRIALFWDCNPNITKSAGHMTYFVHKISPAGHWIRLTGQALNNTHASEMKRCQTYLLVSLSLFEGFHSCWIDKYNYNKIRPETYINRLIDPTYRPFIETPPFPEYPSGHSVVSGCASTILTGMVKQPYTFIDSSEMYINLPPRRFRSFKNAADEASISRFYGGIHFREALDNGLEQGRKIGAYILQKIKLTN